jgi:hypothetical protein
MKYLYACLIAVVRVAVLVLFTVGQVDAQGGPQGPHEAIQNQLTTLQASINNLLTTVNSLQTTANNLQSQVNGMQSQLDHIPRAWSQTVPAAQRFVLALGGAGVLDRETGLVWERSPDPFVRSWETANLLCNRESLGDRLGWRMPTVQELASLVDPTNPNGNPDLPAGHPFDLNAVQSSAYWTATAVDADHAWIVNFNVSGVGSAPKSLTAYFWCVRGGHAGTDTQ